MCMYQEAEVRARGATNEQRVKCKRFRDERRMRKNRKEERQRGMAGRGRCKGLRRGINGTGKRPSKLAWHGGEAVIQFIREKCIRLC